MSPKSGLQNRMPIILFMGGTWSTCASLPIYLAQASVMLTSTVLMWTTGSKRDPKYVDFVIDIRVYCPSQKSMSHPPTG